MKVKAPFEPSLAAQVAGLAAMDDSDFLLKTIQSNKTGMQFIKKKLDAMGIKQVPSAANFITTIWDSKEQATKITQELLEKGVIVRLLASFGRPDSIRISIGLEKDNQKCIACLKEIL